MPHISKVKYTQLITEARDADFWFQKGIITGNKNKVPEAIHCYKEALLKNFDHYGAMYNLAACYE